ncbi:MAG: hypothetical protein KAJ19_11625, partial [Gammaproteobacteria bacterium]|nr:hypothetical protein [Gammaproteobacteria bacterium]
VTVTNVLANDSDADAGDSITLTSVSVAAGLGGTATISGSDILFDPGVSFDSLGNGVTGDATLSYVVTDSGGLISTGTATVTVTGTNDAPTSAGNTMTVTEDVAYVLSATDFAFSDIDTGDALASVRIDSLPGAGSLLLSGGAISATQVITIADINAGKLTYTPVANAYRAAYASFTYSVFDGLVYSAAAATMAIDVTAVNDLPTVDTNTGTSADEGVSVIITAAMLSSSDVESPAANITYSVTGAPAEGLVQLSGTTATSFTQADIDAGNVTYAHTNATLGAVADSITFSVTDADTGAVTGQTFSLTINATIDGTAGIDTLNGGNGNDTISGLAGNDVINGGAGVDTLTGGAGSDTFAYLLADIIDLSTDVITDFEVQVSGAYVDTLDLSDVISNGYTTIAFANSGVDADTSGTLDDLTVSASNGTLTYDIATLTGMGGSTLLQDGTNTNLYYI